MSTKCVVSRDPKNCLNNDGLALKQADSPDLKKSFSVLFHKLSVCCLQKIVMTRLTFRAPKTTDSSSQPFLLINLNKKRENND